MKLTKLILLSPALLLISACTDDSNYDFDGSLTQAQEQAAANVAAEALFDAAAGMLPSPNNLAFLGMQDGTLNISLPEGTPAEDPRNALNTLDGFSTIEPIATSFSLALDPASVVIGETVRVFELITDPGTDTALGNVTGVERELTAAEIVATLPTPERTTLVISPLVPLKEKTTYMFIVTRGVVNDAGVPSRPSTQFLLASGLTPLSGNEQTAPLEPVRLATRPLIDQAEGQQIGRGSIAVAWSMRTQSITDVLATIEEQITAVTPSISSQVVSSPQGLADIRAGTMALPYYRTAPSSINDPVGITSFWTGPGGSFLTASNPMPVATSSNVPLVPVLISIPNGNSGRTMPEAGWPATIFVHGVTRNRKDMFAVADRLALEGRAVVAIDQPMHGITDTNDGLYAGGLERTFNLDLANNTTGQAGPDGITDKTGTHYYSPAQLLATRDNLRQAAADLMVLSASIGNITAGDARIDGGNKTLIGHSLGGTVSTVFLAFADDIKAATLGMPAGGLARMLVASGAFGPALLAGLSASGLEPGTPQFNAFLVGAQTATDSGDAINFAVLAAANTPIHMTEIVGDGTEASPSDQTVPNNVAGAPLAGTDALARVMGLSPVSMTSTGSGLVQFTRGVHSSLIDPTPDLGVFTEIQQEMAIFAATAGATLQIDDPSVVLGN